jgi:DNA-binding transcriptional LysR family regulator
VKVRLTEIAKDDELLALVERGDLDLCFTIYPLPDGPFAAKQLLHDPYVVVVGAKAPFSFKGTRPKLRDLEALPIVTFGEGRSVTQVEAYLRSRGIDLNIVFRSNYNGTVQGFVAAGGAVALAPLLTMDIRNPDTRVLGPIPDLPPRIIGIAWHRDRYRTPAANAFIDFGARFCTAMSPAEDLLKKARTPIHKRIKT